MTFLRTTLLGVSLLFLSIMQAPGQISSPSVPTESGRSSLSSNWFDDLEVLNGKVENVNYRGTRAIHFLPSPETRSSDASMLAIPRRSDFQEGIIEADVAGVPREDAPADARGFIGISFHVQSHGDKYEDVYLRPTNARADDQLRRNHSVQYTSEPEYPWYRLRKESPGVYESYVDLQAGAWIHLKIVVDGADAALYVNHSEQPCLIVKDLKLGKSRGQIALWAHWSTDAYFSNLTVTPAAAKMSSAK